MVDRKQITDYLLKLFGNQPVEPMATAANLAQAYRARPEGMELISDAGGPPPAPAAALPPTPAPQAALPPTPPAASPVQPAATQPPVPAPVAPPAAAPAPMTSQSVYGSKYDDNARNALYDDLANRRRAGAGLEAIGNIADLNVNVGGGRPINAAAGINEKINLSDTNAKKDFEAGRTAMVGEQDRQLSREDKRAALEATLAAKRDSDKLRSEDKRALADIAKGQRDITLGTKQDQFRDKQTQTFRDHLNGSPSYKNWQTMSNLNTMAQESVKNPSPYNDLQLVYATVKALDPTSVVREGEIKLFQGTANLKNQLQGALSTAVKGQPLTPEQKQNVVTLIGQLEKTNKDVFLKHEQPTLNQAKRIGLKLNEIDPMLDDEQPTSGTSGQPIQAGWKVVR